MDIKDLNKTQLILLAVLLSFVTSIATGITTVTLMQQAPASFTTPVNNVIRQTIEKIQQVEGKTTVETVIVKEEDLVVDAIAKNKSSIFTITRQRENADSDSPALATGVGLVVSAPGVIVADAALAPDKGKYYVENTSGKFNADFLFSDKNGFSFLKIGAPVKEGGKLAFTVPSFGDLDKMKVGQKILVVGKSVTSFIFDGNKDIKANIPSGNTGSMVLDLDGNVLGIVLGGETSSFVQIGVIMSSLKLSNNPESTNSLPAAPILAPLE